MRIELFNGWKRLSLKGIYHVQLSLFGVHLLEVSVWPYINTIGLTVLGLEVELEWRGRKT